MRVMIFEPVHGGHRLAYVARLLAAVEPLAGPVELVLGPGAEATPEFAECLAARVRGHRIHSCRFDPTGKSTFGIGAAKLAALIGSIRKLRPDYALIPSADGMAQVAALLGPVFSALTRGTHVEGLVMRGSFAYSTERRHDVARRLLERCPWDAIHVIDPLVYEQLAGHPRFQLCPDPVAPVAKERSAARRALGLAEEGRWLGCVGVLDERKGIDLLIRAFARAKLGETDRLLLAGPTSAAIRAELGRHESMVREGRIAVLDRFVSEGELENALAAMDLVCTPYRRHVGSASVVLRAAATGRPVLGSSFGWIGHTVRTYGLGWTIEGESDAELADAIERALPKAVDFMPGPAAKALVDFNSGANFAAHWTAGIRRFHSRTNV